MYAHSVNACNSYPTNSEFPAVKKFPGILFGSFYQSEFLSFRLRTPIPVLDASGAFLLSRLFHTSIFCKTVKISNFCRAHRPEVRNQSFLSQWPLGCFTERKLVDCFRIQFNEDFESLRFSYGRHCCFTAFRLDFLPDLIEDFRIGHFLRWFNGQSWFSSSPSFLPRFNCCSSFTSALTISRPFSIDVPDYLLLPFFDLFSSVWIKQNLINISLSVRSSVCPLVCLFFEEVENHHFKRHWSVHARFLPNKATADSLLPRGVTIRYYMTGGITLL